VSYDVERPDPVRRRSLTKPLRTAIVLVLLAIGVLYAGRWGWQQLTQPFGDEAAAAQATASATATGTPSCTPAPEAPPPLPEPNTITVNVYNASGVGGIAGQTADELRTAGFVVGAIDNDPLGKRLSGVGEIRSAAASQASVDQLLRYVPGAEWVQDERADPSIDFAIGTEFGGVGEPAPLPEPEPENTEDDIPTC
jgi:hypothetical protein